jgi:hypothetical protein
MRFFLFGYLKEKLKGMHFSDSHELKESVKHLMAEIPGELLCRVLQNWKERLRRVIELEGEYYDK